ncbi:MAG: HEAT repeat domain-containing protein [Planctomycetota bacterium]|nr:HEAT repeat domain-containing protein [Planctomycetota bacterium]
MHPLNSLLVSVLAAGCLCAQADMEERLDAVREFQRYFRKAKDEALQVEAVMTLEGNECAPAATALFALLSHKSQAVCDRALGVLATYQDVATFQGWIDALPTQKDAKVAARSIQVLGRSKIAAAVPAIEAYVLNARRIDGAVKYEVARALASIGVSGQAGLLPSFLADAEAPVRMAACDAVAKLKVREAASAVIKLLSDDAWQVRSAAIEAVAALRPQDAVQPLIDLLRAPGRLQAECADALFRVTAMDLGLDADRWQRQWDKLTSIEGWRIPSDEELAKKAASRRKYDALYGAKQDARAFAGIPTTSTNVLFVIDISGSMDDLVVEVDKFRGYRDRKRFTIVQTELLNTIETLSKDTNFNIVAFATDLMPWKKRLVPANVVNRDAAKQFVARLKPLGGAEAQELASSGLGGSANLAAGKTNTLKALLYGFGVDPAKPPKRTQVGGYDKKVARSKRPLDTIYFLSDGRPSVGKLIDPIEILAAVRKQNELFRVVIHAIAIGDFQKGFLEQLAWENGGVFVDMGR